MPPQSQNGVSPVRNGTRGVGTLAQQLPPRREKRTSSGSGPASQYEHEYEYEYGAHVHAHANVNVNVNDHDNANANANANANVNDHDHDHDNAHAHAHDNSNGLFRQDQQQQKHSQGELRVAYKAQTNSNRNGFNGFNGSGSGNGNGFNNTNTNMFDNGDQHSMSAGSAANSAATPSSVYMPSSVALSRDNMSDLSGVSGGTHRGSSSHTIPGQIFDPKSLMKPWKQAYDLSNIPPECNRNNIRTTRTSELSSTGGNGNSSSSALNSNSDASGSGSPSIWVAQNDVVEIFDNLESSLGLDRFQIMGGQHNRIPVMILLMNPPKQTYELMQIWVDRAIDSIRDLVQVLQHKLPDKWKQAYDGIFQVRGHRFTQLINIIRLVKYDIQPHEILVAKPWAMTAKVTIAFAGSAIRHLTRIGVITTDNNDTGGDKEQQQHRQRQPKNEDAPLLLSKRAQDRVYFPEGILNHHHAMQFMTFSPPFESANYSHNNEATTTAAAGIQSSTTNLSSSHNSSKWGSGCLDDAHSSSLGSDTSNQRNSGLAHVSGNVMASLGGGRRMSSQSFSKRGYKNNNNRSTPSDESCTDLKILTTSQRKSKQGRDRRDRDNSRSSGSGSRGGLFSKLNCLRNSNSYEKSDIGNTKSPLWDSSLTALSEEEEKRWLGAYSMKPIAEDQSIAGGSIVSMSAPLLSPTVTSQVANNNNTRMQTFRPQQPQAVDSGFGIQNGPRYGSRNRVIDNEYQL